MNIPRSHPVRRRPTGFSLIEMLVVIIVAGLLMAIAIPKMGPARDGSAVRSAKQTVLAYIASARQAAISRGGTGNLVISGDTVSVTSTTAGVSTSIAPAVDLGKKYGVTLTTSVTSVDFNARGMARLAGPATLKFARNAHVDSVCITILGMVGKCGL